MKTLFSLVAISVMITLSQVSFAQGTARLTPADLPPVADLVLKSTDENTYETAITNVNVKAVRDFNRSHKNISNVRWFKFEDGFIAYFLSNQWIDTRIIYNSEGGWQCTLLTYTEGKLPPDIRTLVQSGYPHYHISYINEYQFATGSIFIIKITTEKHTRTLRVFDNQLEEIME